MDAGDRRRMSDESPVGVAQQRQGIGRVRHLDASLLWVQQKEKDKVLTTGAIPTELNCADIGAKNLTRKRLFGLHAEGGERSAR